MTKVGQRFVMEGVRWGFSFLTIKMAQESTVSCANYGFLYVFIFQRAGG